MKNCKESHNVLSLGSVDGQLFVDIMGSKLSWTFFKLLNNYSLLFVQAHIFATLDLNPLKYTNRYLVPMFKRLKTL